MIIEKQWKLICSHNLDKHYSNLNLKLPLSIENKQYKENFGKENTFE